MRKLIIALAIMALLAMTVYAADNLCSNEKDCNTKQTIFGTPQYCDTTGSEKKCKDMSEKSKDGDVKTGEEFCKESVPKGGKCRLIGSKGCDNKELVCAGDTNKDKCDFPEKEEEKDKPSAKEGDRCDGSEASKTCMKEEDLHCHSKFSVCVKLPGPGEPCLDGECQVNSGCHYGMCVAAGAIGDGQFAAVKAHCESGEVDVSGRCKPTYADRNYRQQCQANSDCQSDELCDMERGVKDGWGTCVGGEQHAKLELDICKGQRCVGDENNKNCEYDESKCLHAKVRLHCAQQCKEHESNRKALQGTKDVDVYAYAIDCASGSATPLEDNQCELKPEDVIKNCDAVFSSYRQSSASNLSSSVVALIAAAAAVVALVF